MRKKKLLFDLYNCEDIQKLLVIVSRFDICDYCTAVIHAFKVAHDIDTERNFKDLEGSQM